MELPERKVYTVSELTAGIRELLEKEFPSVWIQGEISNFRAAPSGHLYFTLKDESAQIRCVMFKIQSRFLRFKLEDGLRIIGWGRLSVYGARGEYQIIMDTLEPMGFGSLMLAFEQLKSRLAAEGLFDESRKKPLPRFPRTIGVVTSPRGAAVRDMIRIIRRRFPAVTILVSSATVQGDRAPDEIVDAIERLCAAGDVDAVIVGRGGGSIEDLWAFNDERVVRAVCACPLPIISAVGHETDVTLTDFAADLRASTPSAAAELAVPDKLELMDGIVHMVARVRNSVLGTTSRLRQGLNELAKRLYDPRRQIQERRMRMDDLIMRLGLTVRRRLELLRGETSALTERMRPQYLQRIVAADRQECGLLFRRLERSMSDALKHHRTAAENSAARLDDLSPLAILSRGYSITLKVATGDIITDAATVETGDRVRVQLHRGELSCQITGKKDSDVARSKERDVL
ncbi:MAG: exodeoxyribonuclease VII large subunit [Desulfomonile tiedjei]|nr:exodeoxyribonuclease VII large subunit [Desulfomonile tiedjei]